MNEPEQRERGRGFPQGSTQDNVRFVWPECMNTKLFGTGSPPRYLPISPRLPEPSSPGALSICAKFIRLPSVCVAIMAAPSCCSSKSSYGLQRPCTGAREACECSQLRLWLTALIMKRPVPHPHPPPPNSLESQHPVLALPSLCSPSVF